MNHTITEPIQVEILKSLFDLDIVLSIIGIAITGIFAFFVFLQTRKQSKQISQQKEIIQHHKKQLDYHKNLEAFKTLREFRQDLRSNHKNVVNTLDSIQKRYEENKTYSWNSYGITDNDIRKYLNELEIIAIQESEKMLKIEYIDQVIGTFLLNIALNTDVWDNIIKKDQKDDLDRFKNLDGLLLKIKKIRNIN